MKYFQVLDFETTGFDPSVDKVIEIGVCNVTWECGIAKVKLPVSWLCDPGIPIPPTARAVHHISDDMVRGEPPFSFYGEMFKRDLERGLLVAHNAAFDQSFAEQSFPGQADWLCTMRLAKHLWPDAPAYGNEVLRYWRELEINDDSPTHRAKHDACVTAHLLAHMLPLVADKIDDLVAWANRPVVLRGKVGFGKHGDLQWPEVPKDYLQWMIRQGEAAWDKDVFHTAKYFLEN